MNKISNQIAYKIVAFLIIVKPISDLGWRWPIFYVGPIAMPIHRVLAIAVPAVITFLIGKRLIWSKKVQVNANLYAAIFLLAATISLFVNFNIYSLDEYIRLYSFLIVFLSVPLIINTKQKFSRILKALVIVSLLPTLLSYLQVLDLLEFTYYDWLPEIGKIGRVSGGYRHPTGYLNYIIVLLPAIFYLKSNKNISPQLFWVWLLVTLPMVIRTFHRATLIIIIFQIAAYILFLKRNWRKYIIAISGIVLIIIFSNNIWQLINQGGSITEGHFRGRRHTWSAYIEYFQSVDLSQRIFGFGSPRLPSGYSDPHADWLRIGFNYGYVGAVSYFLFLISIFLTFMSKFLKIKRRFKLQSEMLLGLVIIGTIALYSVTMEPLRYSSFSWLAAIVLGFVYMSCGKTIKFKI